MNAIPQTVPGFPADVVEFAREKGLTQYLEPLREMTWRVYPTAVSVAVVFAPDPEISELGGIVFEVSVPKKDYPDYVAAVHLWTDEYFHTLPPPNRHLVGLSLRRVDA